MALLVLAVADLMTSGLLCTLNDRCCSFPISQFQRAAGVCYWGNLGKCDGNKGSCWDRVNVPLEPPVSHTNTHRQFHNLKIP